MLPDLVDTNLLDQNTEQQQTNDPQEDSSQALLHATPVSPSINRLESALDDVETDRRLHDLTQPSHLQNYG